MKVREGSGPQSPEIHRAIMASIGGPAFRQYRAAFALMGLIPLGISAYVLAARLFTIEIFEGVTGVYFLIAVTLMLLGFLLGRSQLQVVLGRLIGVSVQLRQHEIMKSGFVANIAYELRPPLAAVHVSLKNLSDGLLGPLTEAQRESMRDCQLTVGRLSRLTSDLIDLTDAARERHVFEFKVFDIQAVIRDALKAGGADFAGHRLAIALEAQDAPVLFFGDRARFLDAFRNVIDYVVRWSSEGSTVRLGLRFLPQELRVLITHDTASRHDEFFRGLETFVEKGGSLEQYLGLGLHLTKNIIERHHGRFWVERCQGRENRLVISLPILDPMQEPPAPHPSES